VSDDTYMEAVKRGDMKTAQRMVDAAAEAAGYDLGKLYHGNETGPLKSITRPLFLSASKNDAKAYSEVTDTEAFTKLTLVPMERSKVRFPSKMDLMRGWPIADDFVGEPFTPQVTADGELFYWDGETNAYGDNNLIFISNRIADDSGFVVNGKPAVEETSPPRITPFIGSYYVGGKLLAVKDSRFAEPGQPSAVNVIASRLGGDLRLVEKWKVLLRQRGYSGIDTFSDDGLQRGLRVRNVVMFDPTQIKSADPVTYDDMDNVIPLSQRFNSQSEEISNPYTKPDLREQDAKALERLPKPRRTLVSSYNDGAKSLTQDPQFYDVPDYVGYDMARTAAFDLGRSGGMTPRWVMAERIGKLPEGGRSKNFAEDRMEKGVSVLRILGEDRSDVGTYEIFNKGQKRYVAGWMIGTGSDGEPLLVDTVDLGPVEEERLNPNTYTKPDLRERLKRKVMAGSKGGNPGQWSARKAQLLAAEYEKAGGGYTGKRSGSQKSLSKWTQQDWRTKSGKPSLATGERYLPAKAIEGLTAAEYAATTRAKRKATGQFSRQPKRIAMKTKEFRNPVTPTIRKKLASVIEFDDRILCYDTATDEDFYRLWDIIHTDLTLNKESLREIEGMLDDDGVLVIESGESPAGLQDHFRKTTRYQGLLLVQGPLNPEQARIETEKLRRDLE